MKRNIFLILFSCLFLTCKNNDNHLFFGGFRDVSDRVESLIKLLEETKDEQHLFVIRKEIAKELKSSNQKKRLIVFLTSFLENEKDNKYNAYFLLMLANEYIEVKMIPLATYYFEKVASLNFDLIVNEKSIKLISLNALIRVTEEAEKLIKYYSILIRDFQNDIDMAHNLFMLARSYERVGEWNMAIQTYEKFLRLKDFDVIIPGIHDSYAYAKKIVDYSSSSKDWTVETLEELLGIIRYAIQNKNYALLEHYRSKVNFFVMSWKQDASDGHSRTDYTIYNLMYAGNIQIANSVDSSSTPYEAYLRTSGWIHYMKTWYFYLKKINFPADPSIHGRWEWAGIYYGEKL